MKMHGSEMVKNYTNYDKISMKLIKTHKNRELNYNLKNMIYLQYHNYNNNKVNPVKTNSSSFLREVVRTHC